MNNKGHTPISMLNEWGKYGSRVYQKLLNRIEEAERESRNAEGDPTLVTVNFKTW